MNFEDNLMERVESVLQNRDEAGGRLIEILSTIEGTDLFADINQTAYYYELAINELLGLLVEAYKRLTIN